MLQFQIAIAEVSSATVQYNQDRSCLLRYRLRNSQRTVCVCVFTVVKVEALGDCILIYVKKSDSRIVILICVSSERVRAPISTEPRKNMVTWEIFADDNAREITAWQRRL